MIITQSRLAFDFIIPSLLKADKPHVFGIPYKATSRWQPDVVMQRLVDAGLAKVVARKLDGSIAEIYAKELTVQQVEDVCLTDADRERIAKWIKKGVV